MQQNKSTIVWFGLVCGRKKTMRHGEDKMTLECNL